jgi:hypothetical protein
MIPSIPPGSRLDLAAVEGRPDAVGVGEVAVYLGSNGEFVAHRVVAIEHGPAGRVLVTRGDNQDRCERVPASAVAFRVLRVTRGRISYATAGPVGRALARLAVRGGLPWRAFRRLATRTLRLVARTGRPSGGRG